MKKQARGDGWKSLVGAKHAYEFCERVVKQVISEGSVIPMGI